MTEAEVKRAQDMIAAMEVQRNQALTQVVYLQADLQAANRRIAELEAEKKTADEPSPPLPNGHSEGARV